MHRNLQQPTSRIRVGLVNTYMQGRETLISSGEYPSHHLWGADHLDSERFSLIIIPTSGVGSINRLGKWLSLLCQYRFGDIDQEIEIWKRRNDIDLLYVADGNLFWIMLLHIAKVFRPKIVRWRYVPPIAYPWWKLLDISFSRFFLKGNDLLLCLTKTAAQSFIEKFPRLKCVQVDWGADPLQFFPGNNSGNFFFACGRTSRDYSSLLSQAKYINAQIHLVVNKSYIKDFEIPPNVHIGQGTTDIGTDRGIPYPTLLSSYFHKAAALLIPLKLSPDSSAGMTNLLEGMACGLPIVMTRCGAIDLDIESLGLGLYVEPGDSKGWANACNWLIENPIIARSMGQRGRQLVLEYYNTRRLGSELSDLFKQLYGAT